MTYGVVHGKTIATFSDYEEAKRWLQNAKIVHRDVRIYELTEITEYKFTHSLGTKVN